MARVTEVSMELFPDRVRGLIRTRTGPVGVFTGITAGRVARTSQRLVGVKTGATKRSIRARPTNPSPFWRVEARSPAAKFHHEGHQPFILPLKTGTSQGAKVYVFEKDTGELVFTKGPISIPRVKPNRFLVNAARSHGLTVPSSAAASRDEVLIAHLGGRLIRRFAGAGSVTPLFFGGRTI